MRLKATLVAVGGLAAGGLAEPLEAQSSCWFRGDPAQVAQRPSPPDSTEVQLGGATVKVCYGSPSAHGRTVMGSLVPMGEPWRLGANEATSIHLPFAADIAGVRVPAGQYTLYAVPGEKEWDIVVNRAVERWGTPIGGEVRAQDVGSGKVMVEPLPVPVEQLHIQFASPSGNAVDLVVEWEMTRIRIPVRRAGT